MAVLVPLFSMARAPAASMVTARSVGTIQFRGAGRERTVALPAGTLRVKGEAVCASLQGIPFEPCFLVEKTDHRSFRGSWMEFAYWTPRVA